MLIDWSQTRPGPVNAARKMPDPNSAFWMPWTVVMLNYRAIISPSPAKRERVGERSISPILNAACAQGRTQNYE